MKRVSAIVAMLLVGACAGPVRTHFGGLDRGSAAEALPAFAAAAETQADPRWPVIEAALAGQGLRADPASPYQLAFSYGSRPAVSAIAGPGGAILSPAKKHHLFQTCHDRAFRLVVTLIDTRSGEIAGRGWADEAHCRASADEALPALASRAATMLIRPVAKGTDVRWSRD